MQSFSHTNLEVVSEILFTLTVQDDDDDDGDDLLFKVASVVCSICVCLSLNYGSSVQSFTSSAALLMAKLQFKLRCKSICGELWW